MNARVTLAECPPGLFRFDGGIGFKSEYGAMELATPPETPGPQMRWSVGNRADAYCAGSGEYFWGGATTREERDALLVEPISCAPLMSPDNAVAHRFRFAADILEGMSEGIDGDRLGALIRWALHGRVAANEQDALVRAFAAPWLAAKDEAGWGGSPTAQAARDITRITAEAEAIGGD